MACDKCEHDKAEGPSQRSDRAPDTSPAVPASARHNATTGRFGVEPSPIASPGGTRSFERNYDVQAFTGYPASTVAAGQWYRGQLVRQFQPSTHLTPIPPMYDPTDPRTWPPTGVWQPN